MGLERDLEPELELKSESEPNLERKLELELELELKLMNITNFAEPGETWSWSANQTWSEGWDSSVLRSQNWSERNQFWSGIWGGSWHASWSWN